MYVCTHTHVCIRERWVAEWGVLAWMKNQTTRQRLQFNAICQWVSIVGSRRFSISTGMGNGKWGSRNEERRRAVKHNGNHNASPIWGPISISHMHIEHLVSAIDVGGCVCFSPPSVAPILFTFHFFSPKNSNLLWLPLRKNYRIFSSLI